MSDGANDEVTRLAPSPTGALHLGNARTFLINWAMAKQRGWRVVLRIDDLDTPRTKANADLAAIEDLRWLGMDWSGEPVYQTDDMAAYHDALRRLGGAGLIYPCTATRKEIEAAASAPHADEHEVRYPGINRPAEPTAMAYEPGDGSDGIAYRLRVPDEQITFTDERLGERGVNVQQHVGDFVVAAKSGLPAYQLAVVIDDVRQGVTAVVRGDDLLESTARQVLVYRMLGLGPTPRYWHLPLVLGDDGRRLAKRHGDTRLGAYREAGASAERIVGLLAAWSGVTARDEREPMSAAEFAARFELAKLPVEPIRMNDADQAWLIETP